MMFLYFLRISLIAATTFDMKSHINDSDVVIRKRSTTKYKDLGKVAYEDIFPGHAKGEETAAKYKFIHCFTATDSPHDLKCGYMKYGNNLTGHWLLDDLNDLSLDFSDDVEEVVFKLIIPRENELSK